MKITIVATGEVRDEQYANELVRQLRMWFGLSSIQECFWVKPMDIANLQITLNIVPPVTMGWDRAEQIIDAEVARLKEQVRFYIESRAEVDQLTDSQED